MTVIALRALAPADLPFARAMLYESMAPRPLGEPEEVVARPEIRKYLDAWGRRGDRGFVASLEGIDAGAVWYRLFPESDPGYGFVDVATPEISTLAVVAELRGRGVGTRLLETAIAAARDDGFVQLSLSVHRTNTGARQLYERAGFLPREEMASSNEGSVTMVLKL